MYIRKQPSGNTQVTAQQGQTGRGEYEINGDIDGTPRIRARAVVDHELFIRFGRYDYRATGTILRLKYGKKRVELLDDTYIHAARQVQAALLFPEPRRDERGVGGGRPTIMAKRYIMRRMLFRDLQLPQSDRALIELGDLELDNGSQTDSVSFPFRMKEIEVLHDSTAKFPDPIRDLLIEHQKVLLSPVPIPERAEQIVEELMRYVAENAADFNVDYANGADVVPPLKEIANLPVVEKPDDIESIHPDEVEIRLREAAKWRRFVAARGPASARFRRAVREAYNSTCVVCGIRLPLGTHCRVPGVDSAHILPWATHDLDIVANGLCLCKLHHWAFDQQLVAIRYEAHEYHVAVTNRAANALDESAIELLRQHEGLVPAERLPIRPQDKPRPRFLAKLDELLGD